jgi:hypothetical protein
MMVHGWQNLSCLTVYLGQSTVSDTELHIAGRAHGRWVCGQIMAVCELGVVNLKASYHNLLMADGTARRPPWDVPPVTCLAACCSGCGPGPFAIWPKYTD